jgi:hypothetical protein
MTSRRRRFVGLIGFALVGLTLKRQAHAQNPSDPEESPARNSDIITGAPAVPPAWCFGEPNSKQVYGRVDADFFADFTCLRQSDSDVDNVWTARSDGEGRFRGGRLTSAPTPYRGQGVGAQFDDISREGLYPFPMGGGRVGLLYTDAGWGNRFDVYPSLLAPAAPGTRQLPSVPAYLIGAQSFLVSSYVSAVDHDTYTCSEAPYELTVPCRTSVREVGVRNTIDGPVYYAYLSMAHRDTVTGYSYDEEAPALVQFFPDAAITPQWSPPLWELDAVYGTIEDDFFTKKQCDTLVADFDNDRNVDIVTQNCLKQQAMGSSASGVGGGPVYWKVGEDQPSQQREDGYRVLVRGHREHLDGARHRLPRDVPGVEQLWAWSVPITRQGDSGRLQRGWVRGHCLRARERYQEGDPHEPGQFQRAVSRGDVVKRVVRGPRVTIATTAGGMAA